MTFKTITLSGTEQAVKIEGAHCDVRNDGVDVIYAATCPNITPGADDVVSIPAGSAVKLLETRGRLYLLGTGSVQLCGNDYADQVFKCAPAAGGGGSGEDTVARNAITALTAEVTANTDALEELHGSVSSPNLLINPDFSINQRGKDYYYAQGYTVDGWKITSQTTKVVPTENGISLENAESSPSHAKSLVQYIENYADYRGKTVTFSVSAETQDATCYIIISDGTGTVSAPVTNGGAQVTKQIADAATELRVIVQLTSTSAGRVNLHNAKLELGNMATAFVPPDPTTELAKCQRYLLRLPPGSGYRTTQVGFGDYIDFAVPTPVTMRNIVEPTIIGADNLRVQDWSTLIVMSGWDYTVQALADNQLIIRATHADRPFTDAVLGVYDEAVLISAEL